ncbi:SDR family oxidoreductase [Myxococcota bacterium]|nr:SDR family oxidoreductase [Myxococcota bacterium]
MNPENIIIAGSNSRLGKYFCDNIQEYFPESRLLSASRNSISLHNNYKIGKSGLEGEMPENGLLIITIGDHRRSLLNEAPDDFREIIESNFTIPSVIISQARREMKSGSIIVFSDAMIDRPMAGYSAYYAAKVALEKFVEIVSVEAAPNLRINCIAPGIVNLKSTARHDAYSRWTSQVPLRKLAGEESILQTIVFLWENEYITGSIITVDGGISNKFFD